MTVPDITDQISGGTTVSFSLLSAAEYAFRAKRVRPRARAARSAGQVSKQRTSNRGMIEKNIKLRWQLKNGATTAWAQLQDLFALMGTFNGTNEMIRQVRFDAPDGVSGTVTLIGDIESLTVPLTGGQNVTHINGEIDFLLNEVVSFQ